jgi:hypothetical protein
LVKKALVEGLINTEYLGPIVLSGVVVSPETIGLSELILPDERVLPRTCEERVQNLQKPKRGLLSRSLSFRQIKQAGVNVVAVSKFRRFSGNSPRLGETVGDENNDAKSQISEESDRSEEDECEEEKEGEDEEVDEVDKKLARLAIEHGIMSLPSEPILR